MWLLSGSGGQFEIEEEECNESAKEKKRRMERKRTKETKKRQ